MDFDVSYELESADQFWDGMSPRPVFCGIDTSDMISTVELEDIHSAKCATHEAIDNSLRSYLAFTTNFRGVHKPVFSGKQQ